MLARRSGASSATKELKIGIVLSYLLIAINIVSGLFLVPLIINGLGKSNYGLYTAASSLITMFIVDLGLGTAVTKFVSKYRVTSNQEKINEFISVVFYCFLGLDLLLIIIFSCIYPFLGTFYSSFTPDELRSFKYVYIIVASYSVVAFPFSITNGMLVSYDKIFLSKLADIISKIVFIVLTIIVIFLNMGLYFLTACYAVHGLLSILLKIIFVKIGTPCHFFTKLTIKEFKSIFKSAITFSIWAAINSFGRVVLISFAPTILGFASKESQGAQEIALFAIATQIESYVSLFATSFGSIFYPSISRILFSDGEPTTDSFLKFQRFHVRIARFQIIILAIIIVGLITCGNEFLCLWVGQGYEDSYYCILALCIPALFFYPLQTAENAMAAIEKIKFCAIATIISTVLGICVSISLAYSLGAIGVSIGICIGFISRTVLFNVFFAKHLMLKPFRFYLKAYVSFLPAIAIALATGFILNLIFVESSWTAFLLKVVVIALIYFLVVCIFGLNVKEKQSVDSQFLLLNRKITKFIERVEK